jgi:phosphoribosylformylglycinamidine (FGAM) synthase-like amidotransferase family enzyme
MSCRPSEHVHAVGHDVIEQPLVVSDEQHAAVGRAQRIHAARHDLERVDVESRVRLVEHGERRFEHQHLQDLVALLLAAGESFIDTARQKALVHLHELHLAAHELQEFVGIDLRQAGRLALGVHGSFQ